MKATDIQLMMCIRGLYREGYRTIKLGKLQSLLRNLEYPRWIAAPVRENAPRWFKEAVEVIQKMTIRPHWDVWNFSDRFGKAVARLAKQGRIRVLGEKTRNYGYRNNAKIYLWDYTIDQIFGDQRLQAIVSNKVS